MKKSKIILAIISTVFFSTVLVAGDLKQQSASVKNPEADYKKVAEQNSETSKDFVTDTKTNDTSGLLYTMDGTDFQTMDLNTQMKKNNYKK